MRTHLLLFAIGLIALLSVAVAALGQSPATRPVNPAALTGGLPVRLIFDTDMDSDCDDAGALGILHALADRGEVELLAVVTSTLDEHAAACTDAINTYFGRPEVPIGTARPPAPLYKSKYTKAVADAVAHDLKRNEDAPHAVDLYRRILAAQPDHSVTIVTVGDMTNLAKLLATRADERAPSGMELARDKVKLWVCMGGNFIGKPAVDDLKRGNNNFTVDAASTYLAITQWPGPIVFAGREVCSVPSGLTAGGRLVEAPADHPVRIAYAAYHDGQVKARHVADLATVLVAVRGLRDYWDAEPGAIQLNPDMTFTWRYDRGTPHAYLLKRNDAQGQPNDREIERILDELLLHQPATRATRRDLSVQD